MYGIRTIFNSDILCFFSFLLHQLSHHIFFHSSQVCLSPCFSFKCFNVFNIWGIFSRTIFSGLNSIFPRFIFIWKMLMSMICPIYICFTFPRTYFFLALGFMFLLVPSRIIIHRRIILTVRIQVQPVPAVHILLHKPSNHRIVKSRPQIILPAGLVILLSRLEDSVMELFHAVFEHAKRIGFLSPHCFP